MVSGTKMRMDIKKPFNEMSVLFPLLTLYTIIYLGMMLYDFVAKTTFDMPSGMMAVYIALVGAYAADKEIRRWLGKDPPSNKQGSVFVYLWMVFFLTAFVLYSFKREFAMPADLTAVALQVLGIFFGSKASKKIYEIKTGKGAEVATREITVMEMIRQNGRVAKREVVAKLSISDSTALRLLNELEKKGLIRQEGEQKGAYYVAAK